MQYTICGVDPSKFTTTFNRVKTNMDMVPFQVIRGQYTAMKTKIKTAK